MLSLYDDIIIKIADELSDKQKIYMTMLSKQLDHFKFKFIYVELVSLSKIKMLPYFDNFENVELDIMMHSPKFAKFIHFLATTTNIPDKITNLTFNENFNQSIKDCIPSSVSHLTFGWKCNQPIKDCIPSSVSHLTFGHEFNQPIKDCIPL